MELFSTSYDQLDPQDVAFLQELAACAPVILVTARPWAMKLKPTDLGIAAIQAKPYDAEELLSLVRRVSAR